MGKSTRASASSSASRSRGLTVIDTATSSPSLPLSGAADGVHCQTLMIPPASGADGLKKQKPWNFGKHASKGQGQTYSKQTDTPLALFFTWLQLTGSANGSLNHSTFTCRIASIRFVI